MIHAGPVSDLAPRKLPRPAIIQRALVVGTGGGASLFFILKMILNFCRTA
jgi:hypothetical protein